LPYGKSQPTVTGVERVDADRLDNALKALADDNRRRILTILQAGPTTVGDIAEGFDISRPAVSQHLAVLERAQLIAVEKRGTRRVCSIRHDGFREVSDFIGDFWTDALIQLKRAAEGRDSDPSEGPRS